MASACATKISKAMPVMYPHVRKIASPMALEGVYVIQPLNVASVLMGIQGSHVHKFKVRFFQKSNSL